MAATQIDHSWVEVDKIPVLREKLYDVSTGEERPGNRLEVKLSDKLTVLDEDDKEIVIRRIGVVLPNGTEQETKYYIKVDPDAEADDKVVTETWLKCTVDSQDVYYAAQIHESGAFTVDIETTAEQTPEEFYILTDGVRMDDEEKFFEQIKKNGTEELIDGAELFVVNKQRPEYKHFTNNVPDMTTPEEGDPYTAWIQKWGVANDHNEAIYSEDLKLEDLEQIIINQVIYDQSIPYTVQTTDAVYPWTYYPAGDFYLIEQDGCEAAAENLTKTDYACKGAALFGNVLNVYFVSAADAEGYAAVYIMDGDDRISMVIGKPGDEVELPTELKKLGWDFKGYEEPVPTHFTAAAQSVNTIWQKIEDGSEEDDSTPKHKATWTVPGKNWSYSVNVEVGADVPAAPTPGLENISITSWTLKSDPFDGNKMPDYDILYEAVFTETAPGQTPTHTLTYQIQYTTEDNQSHTDTYKTYQIAEGAAITPEPAPYKRGGTFQGWQNLPAYMPNTDLTVTGTFSGKVNNSITITYYVDGQVNTTQNYTPGDAVTAPSNPTQSGKVFSGWIGVPNVAPTYDMEVQGYFYDEHSTDLVTIKYVVDNQTYKTYRLQKGASLPTEPAPVKTGYTFSGWSPVLSVVPNVDTTISGTFTADAPGTTKYDLKFYLQDSSQLHSTLYAQYKLSAGEAIVAPTCEVDGFQGWQNVPQVMPSKNLDIYGIASGETQSYAVNVTYEYTNADGTKTNVKGTSYLLVAGAVFTYPTQTTPDQEHADYLWKGWTGDEYILNGRMPAKEVNLVGHFASPDIDSGTVEGKARIEWRLPNYDPNGLNHDPYDVYKFEYVTFGEALVAPTNVPNYTGRDGNQYQFTSWGTYPATAPSSTQTVRINGTSTRVSEQFEVKYYLYRYELGATDAVKFLYKTMKVYPGTSMATIHTQVANEIATDYPEYLFKGQWYQMSFYVDEDTMGWFDRAYYSHLYSPEYAEQTGTTIAGFHKVKYQTHTFAPGLAPTYTPYIDGVAVYKIADTKWVAEGATFTDPTGPFTAPFPHGSKFTFAGWEEHSNVMGTSDITVWATWQYMTYPCEISWIIKKIDENKNETEITHAVTVQQQGFALQWPEEPVAPENYLWAGWDVYTYPGFTNLVWREAVHTVYGQMVHVNSGVCPSGFAIAKYLLKTHDTKYPPTKYIEYESILAPINGDIPPCSSVPEDWTGLDGNIYHFVEWVSPQNKMPYYKGTLEIVAKDSKVAVEKTLTLQLWMQGGGHNEYEDWATIQVYPGTSLDQVLNDYVAEHGEPTKNGFVWSGIWRCDYDEMPERDCKAVSIMWEYNYYIDLHPESDEYFTIDWVSPYWKGYWRPQDRWTIKTEVVKQGTLITPPADPVMPSGHDDEYNFIGWTGLPADNIMPRRNLTITANWEEAMVKAYVVWNMAIPQSDGTVSYREHFRREIDMSTAQHFGAQAAVGAWPAAPAGDQTMEFVMWTQPYSDTQTPSMWPPMSAADNYSIYYNAQNQTQEYLIGTALMQSLTWDSGRLNGYSRVYWRIPSLIRHYTGYVHYEWTNWKFFYVKKGSVINTPEGTPANVFDYEGVENNFVEWPSHATIADGNDIIINAVYERLAIRYTIRYFATYYNRTGNQTYSPATKLLFTCRAFGGAYLDIIPTADPQDWEFHYHRRNVPVGSHFWAVINDNSGAPLYATWDGTCLYRNMDLCCELWLTGNEATADYVPEETVTLVEWPDGDDMDHGHGQTPDPIKTINCTYFIGNETYLVKSYSDGTAFDNLDESSINSWLESHGQIDYYYDGWDGAPGSGIVYADDYESGSFSVTLKTKYVEPIVVCSYYVQGQLFATRNYRNGNDFVSNVTNSNNVSIASYLSTNNIIGSYSWTGVPVSGKVYKADYPTRAFTVTLNWSQVNWKVEGQTVQTRKYLSNYPVYSASQDSPSAETMETYLDDNNISAEFNQWTGWPVSFENASYDITASITYVTRVYMDLYYISPTGIRTNVGRIRFKDTETLANVQTAVNNFTVDTSQITWWNSSRRVPNAWTYS